MLRIVATTSAQSGQPLGQYVRHLSGKMRPIRSYLTEMLDGLPPPILGFLLRVSILDRLCAGLCQAVTGLVSSQDLLEDIANRQLLLTPLDPEGAWFRCHPVLRSFLRQRLETELPEEIPDLHRRAYRWYAKAELWTDAIQHATAVGDTAQAIGWIEKCAMALLKRGELLALLTWEKLLPSALMKRQVKARLAIAWGMVLAMRFDEALRMTSEIEQDLGDADPQAIEALGCECLTIRAVALALGDDTDAALTLAEASLARHSSGPWTSYVAANVALFGYWKRNDLTRCYALPWISVSGDDGSRNVVATVYRRCLQGLLEYQLLHIASAERQVRDALLLAETHSGPASVAAAMPASLIAQLRYDQGCLDEAEAIVIDRLAVIDAAGMLECVLRSYFLLVRVAVHRGHIERAYALLEQAECLGMARHWPRLVARTVLERVRLHLSERRIEQAGAGVAQLERIALANPAPIRCAWSEIHDDAAMARAELLSARGQHAACAEILRRLHWEAQAQQRLEQALGLAIRLAGACCRACDSDAALALCRYAVAAAAPGGLVQPFRDGGPEIGPLLARLSDAAQRSDPTGVQATFLAALSSRHKAAPLQSDTGTPTGTEPLSPREQGVLALLAAGQSNKDIARALNIAPETVKSHVKSIFAKLGVVRRAQAVSRALSLGLVDAG
jgi:LuxR family maltose regulon positive regulatory protein